MTDAVLFSCSTQPAAKLVMEESTCNPQQIGVENAPNGQQSPTVTREEARQKHQKHPKHHSSTQVCRSAVSKNGGRWEGGLAGLVQFVGSFFFVIGVVRP
jgi:hypothetical protein